jgi:hypothetical protein
MAVIFAEPIFNPEFVIHEIIIESVERVLRGPGIIPSRRLKEVGGEFTKPTHETLLGTFGSAIDGDSFGLRDSLRQIQEGQLAGVSVK